MCTVDGSQGSQMMCLLEISSETQQFSLKLFARNEGMCPQGVVWPFWSRQEQCQVLPLLTQPRQQPQELVHLLYERGGLERCGNLQALISKR